MKVSNESKVGIFAAFGLAILFIGYNFLHGDNIFKDKNYVYVIYENVDGLVQADEVEVNGFRVGSVATLDLIENDPKGRVLVTVNLDEGVTIPRNSIAKLESDILGEKTIQLKLGDAKELVQKGDTLESKELANLFGELRKELLPVKQKAEHLMGSIDSVMMVVQAIVEGGEIERSIDNFGNAINQFRLTAKSINELIEEQSINIDAVLTNLKDVTTAIAENDTGINKVIANLGAVSDSLAKMDLPAFIATLEGTLSEVETLLASANAGEGSLGLLVKDSELYDNLNNSAENLSNLLFDLKQNPGRYVHFSLFGGRKNKKQEPPATQPSSSTN